MQQSVASANFHFHTCITGTGCAMGTVRLSLMQWRRPGGAVVQVYWTEHPQDGALEWSSTGPPSNVAATSLRVSSSELSYCVHGTEIAGVDLVADIASLDVRAGALL